MQIVGGFAILLVGVSICACGSSSTNPATTSTGGSGGVAGAIGGASGASMGGTGGLSIGGSGGVGGGIISLNCKTVAPTCGPTKDEDCCGTAPAPPGPFAMGRSESGTDAFASGLPDEQPEHTANPSGAELDVYEVTVARYKAFVDELPDSLPKAGDGAHPNIPGSGWDAAWDSEVDPTYLEIILQCGFNSTWTSPPLTENYDKPINCVNWYMAFAFCAWDGGYLPTEAEWETAAAGSDENRLYPWGPNDPDVLHASFACKAGGTVTCEFDDILSAGSIVGGKGRFGHYDLAGSMSEWTLDAYAADWYTAGGATCAGCANLTGTDRVLRGGAWDSDGDDLRAARRAFLPPADRSEQTGVRCAREQPND